MDTEIAKNCEMAHQLGQALTLISLQQHSSNSRVEAISMAIQLLQEMIASERELENEHWLLPPIELSAVIRRKKSIKVLVTLVNERILKT